MKKTISALALMGLLVTWTDRACATADDTNDSDQIIITITPNIDRGVQIDTGSVVMDLGAVDLFTATQTVKPATVTILGTFIGQELDLTGAITSAGVAWTFDSSPTTAPNAGTENLLAAYLLFSDTALSETPSAADFGDGTADASYTAGTQRVGGPVSGGTKYEIQGPGNLDMDAKAPLDPAHLWIFFRLPDVTNTSSAQNVTFTLTAVDAS